MYRAEEGLISETPGSPAGSTCSGRSERPSGWSNRSCPSTASTGDGRHWSLAPYAVALVYSRRTLPSVSSAHSWPYNPVSNTLWSAAFTRRRPIGCRRPEPAGKGVSTTTADPMRRGILSPLRQGPGTRAKACKPSLLSRRGEARPRLGGQQRGHRVKRPVPRGSRCPEL